MGSGIMGFFSKLFGRSGAADAKPDAAESAAATEYKGFSIRPAPRRQGSGWLLAGVIAKEFPDGVKEHAFVRADTFAARDEAVAFAVTKARQIIDERGDRVFDKP
jgi:hypothetical protein